MSNTIAFVTDPLDQIDPQKDSTFALMHAAQTRGYQVFWMEAADVHIQHGNPVGYMSSITVDPQASEPFTIGASFLASLNELAAIWWRKTPPYNLDLLFALDALQLVKPSTLVLNDPRTLRNMNENLFALKLPQLSPQTLVTKNPLAIQGFMDEVKGKTAVRQLDAPVSRNSFILRKGDPNLKILTEVLTQNASQYVIAQKLVTESGLDGDKRIYFVDGTYLGIALQIPSIGELKGSFERGSEAATCDLTAQDQQLINTLGPVLKENGIFFATADVADGLITQLNFSCPGGLVELQSISDSDVFESIFAGLEQKLVAL